VTVFTLRWYRLVEAEKRQVGEICTLFGIPKKTCYKWYARDHSYGSNDHHPRKVDAKLKLTSELKQFVESEKRKTNYGPRKMRWAIQRTFGITPFRPLSSPASTRGVVSSAGHNGNSAGMPRSRNRLRLYDPAKACSSM